MKHNDYTKFSEDTENNVQNNPEVIEQIIPTDPEVPTADPKVPTADPEVPTADPEAMTEPEVPTADPETQNDLENNEDNSGTNLLAVVVNCSKLNVRKEARKDADVECVISKGNEVTVDLDASTEDFYKIHTVVNDVLVAGYCVKDFIEIK